MNAQKQLSLALLEKTVSEALIRIDACKEFDPDVVTDSAKQDLQLLYVLAEKIHMPVISRFIMVIAASLAKLDPNILAVVKTALDETTDKIMQDVVEYSLTKE